MLQQQANSNNFEKISWALKRQSNKNQPWMNSTTKAQTQTRYTVL
jgi:hypothetical protein